MILRHYFWPGQVDAQMSAILDFCEKTGCSEMLLFTSSYECMPSFPPLERMAGNLETLRTAKRRFDAQGMRTYLNVMQTLGHVYYPEANQREVNIQPRVSIDGHVSREGGCPLCPNLRAYMREAYRLYGELGMELMFVDDDYRYLMSGCYCFCDRHMKAIGDKLGRAVTREEVREAVVSPKFDEGQLKRSCREVMCDAMVSLAGEIEQSVRAVNPDCRIGVMTQVLPIGNFGTDLRKVADALAGGKHAPIIRPQIGMYVEYQGKDIPAAFINPAVARHVLGWGVAYYPEIENYYYTDFSKSPRVTVLQMLVQYFLGFENLALNLFDFMSSASPLPFETGRGVTRRIGEAKDLFKQVVAAVGDAPVIEGVHVVEDAQSTWHNRALSGEWREMTRPNGYYTYLPNIGLPLGFEAEPAFQVLSGDVVLAKSDVQLDAILSRGAVMDARALECLIHRGMGDRIGVELGDTLPLDDTGSEWMADPEFSPVFNGISFPVRVRAAEGDFRRLIVKEGVSRSVSEIRNADMAVIAPGVVASETPSGARFAVLANTNNGTHQRRFFENPIKQEQLTRLLEWVAGKPLPLKVLNAAYVAPYVVRNDATSERFALLINFASETYEGVRISGAALEGVSLEDIVSMPDGRSGAALAAMIATGDETSLVLSDPLRPYDFVLLRLPAR